MITIAWNAQLQLCAPQCGPAPLVKVSHKTVAIIPRQLDTMTARIAIEPTMTGDSSSVDLTRGLRVVLVRLATTAIPQRNG